MEPAIQSGDFSKERQHKRTTSSVLKSIIPRNHQRRPTAPAICPDLNSQTGSRGDHGYMYNQTLPLDRLHMRQHLREDSGNRNQKTSPYKRPVDSRGENSHAEAFDFPSQSPLKKENARSPKKKAEKDDKSMKKSKSSTSLSALLSRPRSSKGPKEEGLRHPKEKENQTPLRTGEIAPPPIWAQFATQGVPEPQGAVKVPLNDRQSIDEEIRRYTPSAYSPSKQRNFQSHQKPTLSRRTDAKPRPKSECLVLRPTQESFSETVSDFQKASKGNIHSESIEARQENFRQEAKKQQTLQNSQTSGKNWGAGQEEANDCDGGFRMSTAKQGPRVQATIATLNSSAKQLPDKPAEDNQDSKLNPQAVETAFESLLEARNVPQNTRDKMRSLDTKIKADFITKNTFGSGSTSSVESLSWQSSRPNTGKRSKTDNPPPLSYEANDQASAAEDSPKKSRPRSRTFTFSKGDQSPSKKQRSERPSNHQRNKSGELTPSASSKSLTPSGAAHGLPFFTKGNKPATPEEHLAYLRDVQEPEKVEVGRIHKLRQLLRNETVSWVDHFVTEGGMTELTELLYRIINVEWRAEHEDTLLHETLLCLKALSTTSSALHQLSSIQAKLFPTLLGMLFDKEKKGPSEFTTRGIIITLLHTYLTSCPSLDLTGRARLLISYLRDPSDPEEAQAPVFITSIYHPRPYRIWQKELDNVCKEVFWIFLHHVNIIPYPDIPPDSPNSTYVSRHFPRDHPPVPAAPYIGGVEWEATNYLTAHLDLLNGLLASLPTRTERNILRQELKDSGFEKVMAVSLRTCKEKFYGCVHEALSVWVGAAKEDEWPFMDVRQGPPPTKVEKAVVTKVEKAVVTKGNGVGSPVKGKSPKKKRDQPPVLEMPKLDLGAEEGIGRGGGGGDDGGWL